MEQLKVIEKKLNDLIDIDKHNWTNFYLLLKEVEDDRLWEQEKYQSFTQWVKNFCIRTKTHESIIWNRKKAGKVYESYEKIQREKGIEVAKITDINVSADSLVILDKINKYDEKAAAELTEKVLNKEITKKDLREVYKQVRPERPSTNPHLKSIKYHENNDYEENNDKQNDKITANNIVSTLCNIEWLGETAKDKVKRKYFKSAFEQGKYRTFTEFPIFTGTSKKSRRMDMLICENVTTENTFELNLHCIEIKVSKSDLTHDTKYTEYSEFVDYVWLAIPPELIEVAQQNKFMECGIIAIEDNKATIIEQAVKIDSLRRNDTLTNIALKLI